MGPKHQLHYEEAVGEFFDTQFEQMAAKVRIASDNVQRYIFSEGGTESDEKEVIQTSTDLLRAFRLKLDDRKNQMTANIVSARCLPPSSSPPPGVVNAKPMQFKSVSKRR